MLIALLTAVLFASAGQPVGHTFGRADALTVEVRATDGSTLAGVTLRLCKVADRDTPDACAFAVSNASGSATFQRPADGDHVVIGELSGFASTTLGPLSMADDPVAPDQVVVMLNPVCWHC